MSDETAAVSAPGFNSYTDYIKSILPEWPEYAWLHSFLTGLNSLDTEARTFLSIFDFTENGMSFQDFIDSNSEWVHALTTFPHGLATRVIFVSCKGTQINANILNRLGLLYDVDPLFFSSHFNRCELSYDGQKIEYSSLIPEPPLSKLPATQIGFYPYLHASLKVLEPGSAGPDSPATVIILLSEKPSRRSPYTVVLERPSLRSVAASQRQIGRITSIHFQMKSILSSYEPRKIGMIAQYPLSVVLPLLELFIAERSSHLRKDIEGLEEETEKTLGRLEDFSFHMSIYDYAFRTHRNNLFETLRNLRATCRSESQKAWWPELDIHLKDLQDLLHKIRVATIDLDRHKTMWMSRRALEDSRESVRYADSVGRITAIAFIFIPLSFVTSLFGMNLTEFGTGNVKVWVVVVVAAGLFIFSLFIWTLSKFVSKPLKKLRARLRSFFKHIRYFKALALVSPKGAFWMFCFMLTHSDEVYELFLVYAGFKNLDNPRGNWAEPRLLTEETVLDDVLSPFWKRRSLDICETTRMPGWFNHTIFSIGGARKRNIV